MKGLFVFLPVCLACLSKLVREDGDMDFALRRAMMPKSKVNQEREAKYEQKLCARKCENALQKIHSAVVDIENVKSKLDSIFRKADESYAAYVIPSNALFEMKKERNLIWLTAINSGTFESVLAILKEHCKADQKMFFQRKIVDVHGLVLQQVLLWFNHQVYLTTEENINEFICMVGAHYHHLIARSKSFAQLEAIAPFSNGYRPVSEFCSTLAQYLLGFLMTFDNFLEYVNSIRSFAHVPIHKFEEVYMRAIDENLYAAKLESILGDKMFVEARSVNSSILNEFEQRYQRTKLVIEEQFDDQAPEDIDSPIEDEVILASQPTVPDLDLNSANDHANTASSNRKSRAEIMAQYRSNHQSRLEARFEKEKSKHSKRTNKLRCDEKDDDDVRFFYTFKNLEANSTFSLNQAQQVCKTSYPSHKRYEHSMFPGITASGSTINFLCGLLVSGTPTYEGFLAAHKDLGGIFVEKRNGNKLFFFKEPISYHKTLHAPHESSRFDHRLYRMFYRNCGLHPYFFNLTE